MRHILLLSAVALTVSACGIPLQKVVSSSERSVLIQVLDGKMAKAQVMADAECAKHGRVARLSNYRDANVVHLYDCVL